MKCTKCNGYGYIDNLEGDGLKCPKCNGTGEYEPFDTDVELDKLDSETQTNEEWLRSCTTEQLAEAIYNFVWCSSELWQQLCCNGDGTDEESDLRIVREWLKQPHTEKE